jgi:hypothetical protein
MQCDLYCNAEQCIGFHLFYVFRSTFVEDAKVYHDWGSNIITIHRNGIVKTIVTLPNN